MLVNANLTGCADERGNREASKIGMKIDHRFVIDLTGHFSDALWRFITFDGNHPFDATVIVKTSAYSFLVMKWMCAWGIPGSTVPRQQSRDDIAKRTETDDEKVTHCDPLSGR